MQRIGISWVVALALAGCSAETLLAGGDDADKPAGMAAFEELEQCGFEDACGLVSPWDAEDLSCALETLRSGRAARIRIEDSNTGDERFWWDLFVSADGSVQVVYRDVFNEPDADWNDPYDYGWDNLQRCSVAAAHVEACANGLEEDQADASCNDFRSFYEDCAEAEPVCR